LGKKGVKMLEKEPLVSIIIPVYNGRNYLADAIDSALAQTYKRCEVIVVNDGSDDGGETCGIAKSYGNCIRYFEKENGGVASALNLGISKMRGEHFSWLSHDDIYYPEKVETQIYKLKEVENTLGIVYSDYDVLYMETGVKEQGHHNVAVPRSLFQTGVFPVLNGVITACTALIPKVFFDKYGMFKEELRTSQDAELLFRFCRQAPLIYVEESLVQIRNHATQGSKIIKEFKKEQNVLYKYFVRALTGEEIVKIYGNRYRFYISMLEFTRREHIKDAYRYIWALFCRTEEPVDLERESLENYFIPYTNKKIVIFGTGYYGENLYIQLQCRGIEVSYFLDNDINKQKQGFYGKKCFSPILNKERDILVIVALKYSTVIIKNLRQHGYRFVTTKDELTGILFEALPTKKNVIKYMSNYFAG